MPKRITIPSPIEKAEDRLAALDGIAIATGWERAAIVYAFTYEGVNRFSSGSEVSRYTIRQFAALKIKGLTSRNTIDFYRNAWKDAINTGEAKDIKPGDTVVLPTSEFPPQERNQGSRVSANPAIAVDQAIEKHGADVVAKELAKKAPKAVANQVAEPAVAKNVVDNQKAKRQVYQQSAARTQRIVQERKRAIAANPDAAAQTAAMVDASQANTDKFTNSMAYHSINIHRGQMVTAWIDAIREESFTPLDRHYLGADLPSLERMVEEVRAFVEAQDDPYVAVKEVRAQRNDEFHKLMDEAEADTDIDAGLSEIERFANEG